MRIVFPFGTWLRGIALNVLNVLNASTSFLERLHPFVSVIDPLLLPSLSFLVAVGYGEAVFGLVGGLEACRCRDVLSLRGDEWNLHSKK